MLVHSSIWLDLLPAYNLYLFRCACFVGSTAPGASAPSRHGGRSRARSCMETSLEAMRRARVRVQMYAVKISNLTPGMDQVAFSVVASLWLVPFGGSLLLLLLHL